MPEGGLNSTCLTINVSTHLPQPPLNHPESFSPTYPRPDPLLVALFHRPPLPTAELHHHLPPTSHRATNVGCHYLHDTTVNKPQESAFVPFKFVSHSR